MAAEFWKDVLIPGTYRLSDGRRVTYTECDCRNAVAQGNGQLAAGLRVPWCWMHDPDAEPAYLSDSAPEAWMARGFFGDTTGYRLGPAGQVQARVRIEDAGDARQFLKVGTVSPRVDFDWRDETGRVWPGLTVAHVASTPRPIQRGQDRPVRVPAMLSHSGGRSRETHYLGYATREGSPMADEKNDDKGDDEKPDKPEVGDEKPEETPVTSGMTGDVAELVECIRELGIDPGEPRNMKELKVALRAIAADRAANPDGGDPDGLDAKAGAGTESAAMPPMLMSHFTRAAKVVGTELQGRVEKLFTSGRIDGPTRRKLEGQLKAADLSHKSFDAKGDLRPLPVVARIEAYEELPPNRFKARQPADLSHETDAADPPAELNATREKEEAAVIAEQERLARQYSVGGTSK